MHRKTLWYLSNYHIPIQFYNVTIQQKKNTPKPEEAAMRYHSICFNNRSVARKILQGRHYLKRCGRIEFFKLLALYHADSKIVVCID